MRIIVLDFDSILSMDMACVDMLIRAVLRLFYPEYLCINE